MEERFKFPADREARNTARTKAIESLLIEKGVITGETVDKVLDVFETKIGPFNGAKLVARAWLDPAFKERLVADTAAAIAELNFPAGMAGAEGEHMRAVANTQSVHNLIICTLCSCYPWPVLGLPPYWYKDPSFRARGVREPRQSARGIRRDACPRRRDQGVGEQRADPLVCHPRTACGFGVDERGRACRARDARGDDGRGAAAGGMTSAIGG